MKIAVTSQNKTSITEHAGHCQKFWIYETKDGEIIEKKLVELSADQSFHHCSSNEPHPLDDVQVLISGSMGPGLMRRLERKGIEGVIAKETDLDRAVKAYLDGSLVREESECHRGHRGNHKGQNRHQNRHQHRHQHRHLCTSGQPIERT